MKKEEIHDALIDAFQTWWKSNQHIRINGKKCEKTNKYEHLHFSDDVIDMLQQVICCDYEKEKITGTVIGYIRGIDSGTSKSIPLTCNISTSDYTCKRSADNKPEIQIANVMFTKRTI